MLAAVYSGTPCYRSGGSERHGFAAGVHVEQSMELSTKMMNAQTLQGSRRVVLTYPNRPREPQHEKIVHAALAERLAVLLGLSYGGEYDPTRRYDAHPYLVPSGTVVGLHEAHELGLNEEGDLFGGVVPQPFVETKAITHPLGASGRRGAGRLVARFWHPGQRQRAGRLQRVQPGGCQGRGATAVA